MSKNTDISLDAKVSEGGMTSKSRYSAHVHGKNLSSVFFNPDTMTRMVPQYPLLECIDSQDTLSTHFQAFGI
jgi:hypothetical protein